MTSTAKDLRAYRLTSLDMVRGLVVVIMALDHVRDYFLSGAMQDPMKDPNVGVPLFFTRWIRIIDKDWSLEIVMGNSVTKNRQVRFHPLIRDRRFIEYR